MIDFIIGVAVGAAFSPFWLQVWGWVKGQFVKLMQKTNKE